VVAYNQFSVNPKGFEQFENFKLYPYLGKGAQGSIFGQMFLVWGDLAKTFPEIDFWIFHDYDVLVKPRDSEIFELVKPGNYGMIGKPFNYSLKTIEQSSAEALYPFPKKGLLYSLGNANYKYLESELLKNYPVNQEGQNVVLTGYGDFLAAYSKDLLLFTNGNLKNLKNGGSEQAPHTVFGHCGIRPVDISEHFSCFVSVDNTLYGKFESNYDISHPVKFWPGLKPAPFKLRLKRMVKMFLSGASYSKVRPN